MIDLLGADIPPKPYRGSFLRGFAVVVGIAVVQFVVSVFMVLGFRVGSVFLLNARFVGLSQLIYVIPLFIQAKRLGETDELKGIVVGASLVFLLNAMCWGTW